MALVQLGRRQSQSVEIAAAAMEHGGGSQMRLSASSGTEAADGRWTEAEEWKEPTTARQPNTGSEGATICWPFCSRLPHYCAVLSATPDWRQPQRPKRQEQQLKVSQRLRVRLHLRLRVCLRYPPITLIFQSPPPTPEISSCSWPVPAQTTRHRLQSQPWTHHG